MFKEEFPKIAKSGATTITWKGKSYDFLDGRYLLTKASEDTRTRLQTLQKANTSKTARQLAFDVLSRNEQMDESLKAFFKSVPLSGKFKFHTATITAPAQPASQKRKATEPAKDDNAKKPRTEALPQKPENTAKKPPTEPKADRPVPEDKRAINEAKEIFDVLVAELPLNGNCTALLAKPKLVHLKRTIQGLTARDNSGTEAQALLAFAMRRESYSSVATKTLTELLGKKYFDAVVKQAEGLLRLHNIDIPRTVADTPADPPLSAAESEICSRVDRVLARRAASIGTTPSDSRRASVSSTGTILTINTRASAASSIEDGEIASPPAPTAQSTRTDVRLCELSPNDQVLQQRYFNVTDPDALVVCRNCHGRGHEMISCPKLRLPAQQKCLRCRQRGHTANSCTRPSVPAGGIDDKCEECGNSGHAEGECSYLWHNVRPNQTHLPLSMKEIADKIFCSLCGYKGHFARTCAKRVRPHRNIPSSFSVEAAFPAALEGEQRCTTAPGTNESSAYPPSRKYQTLGLDNTDETSSPANGTMPAWQIQQLSNFE